MKKTVALLAFALAIGAAAGFGIGHWKSEREMQSVILAHSLETIALCANGLNSLKGHDAPVTARLLDHRLRSAVGSAATLSTAAEVFELPLPSLSDGLRRAKDYADRTGDRRLSGQIAHLQATIGPHLLRGHRS
ncbi:MAG: hypothetical protein M3P06_05310 [Acidobacteriota bacterium]|nr:hypothetical protein [Acidobacteriota bacterium]